jgi:hypothetical protein
MSGEELGEKKKKLKNKHTQKHTLCTKNQTMANHAAGPHEDAKAAVNHQPTLWREEVFGYEPLQLHTTNKAEKKRL